MGPVGKGSLQGYQAATSVKGGSMKDTYHVTISFCRTTPSKPTTATTLKVDAVDAEQAIAQAMDWVGENRLSLACPYRFEAVLVS